VGPYEEGKRLGTGRLYDAERDEVYEGEFENDRRQGEGTVYRRNGEVLRGEHRSNYMEGTFTLITTLTPTKVNKVFNQAKRTNNIFTTVNNAGLIKVERALKRSGMQGVCMDNFSIKSTTQGNGK
jgi:antitoxin component YwqK of YwqJK toxin-antitoxin module